MLSKFNYCNVVTEVMVTVKELEEIIQKAVSHHTEDLVNTISGLKEEINSLKQVVQSLAKQECMCKGTTEKTDGKRELNVDVIESASFDFDSGSSQPAKSVSKKNTSISKNDSNKHKVKIVRGTGTVENVNKELLFSAAARRAWIYLGRVDHNTRAEQISKYLQNKFPLHNFQVEELPKRAEATSVSFKIGADVTLMDELYNAQLWPAGVLVKKFVFLRRHRRGQF